MPNQTGPTSDNGKKRSSRNAWKHGILSHGVVLPDFEDKRAWEAHRDATFESFEPEGHVEHLLAERIAIIFWKLRRLEFFQTAASVRTDEGMFTTIVSSPQRLKAFFATGKIDNAMEVVGDQAGPRLMPDGWELPKIMKYESHLHRQLLQTMHELEALQTRRQGGHVNLARVDVTGSPSLTAGKM